MASTVIERTTELRRLVASLAELRDGLGVLSITIGIEPGAVSGGTPCAGQPRDSRRAFLAGVA